MSDALLKARQHFANYRSPEQLIEIKVPEWDMSIWYWPHLSAGERRSINIAAQAGATIEGDSARMIMDRHGREAMEVIVRARDVRGDLIFTESEFDALLGCDPDVISRISGEMRDQYTQAEDAAKN